MRKIDTNFTIYSKEKPIIKIDIKDGEVISAVSYTENPLLSVFPDKELTIADVYSFLESRCFENGRAELPRILKENDMTTNNPWEWCKKTHGVNYSDFYWIKYEGEVITWDEVKLHD